MSYLHYTENSFGVKAKLCDVQEIAIHFMRFGYRKYVEELIKLTGINLPEDWAGYESWNPYRLKNPVTSQPEAARLPVI